MTKEAKSPKEYDRWDKTCVKVTGKVKTKTKKVKKGK